MFVVTCGCGANHPIVFRPMSGAIRCSECGSMLYVPSDTREWAKEVMAEGETLIRECRWLCAEAARLRAEAARLREESAALRRR